MVLRFVQVRKTLLVRHVFFRSEGSRNNTTTETTYCARIQNSVPRRLNVMQLRKVSIKSS